MTEFAPLREGFRELNRMLIDSQQWDIRHHQRAVDQKFRQAQLESNLQQQDFNNRMTMMNAEFRKRGLDHAATQLEHTIAQANIANRRADAHLKIAQDSAKINQDKHDEWLHNIENVRQLKAANLTKAQKEAEALEYEYREIPLNINDMVTPEFLQNPEFMAETNSLMQKLGYGHLRSDGSVIGADGNIVNIFNKEGESILRHINAIAEGYDDKHTKVRANANQLAAQYADLSKQLKNTVDEGPHHFQKRSQLKLQLSKIAPVLQQHQHFFTPEGQIEWANEKISLLEHQQRYLYSIGETESADSLAKSVKRFADIATAQQEVLDSGEERDAEGISQHEIWLQELNKDGTAQFAFQASFDRLDGEWTFTDPKSKKTITTKVLPQGLQPIKPTEQIGLDPNLTSEEAMVDVSKVMKERGMIETMFAGQGRPYERMLVDVIRQTHMNIFDNNPAMRGTARDHSVNRMFDATEKYYSDISTINKMNKGQLEQYISDMKIDIPTGRNARQYIKELAFLEILDTARALTDNPNFTFKRGILNPYVQKVVTGSPKMPTLPNESFGSLY